MQRVSPTRETKPTIIPSAPLPAGSGLAEIAHDARSLVTALGLYCDLLAEPGILAECHRHYVDELRLVTAATRRLTEKLGAASRGSEGGASNEEARPISPCWSAAALSAEPLPQTAIQDIAAELRALRNLLAAVAGASVSFELRLEGGEVPVRLTMENLIRVLVNLVRNAAEAMPGGGAIVITLRERKRPHPHVVLAVEDNGPGVPEGLREAIFAARFTTKTGSDGMSRVHHGLGLSITRSIVEAAGGRISAGVRRGGGARFEVELPIQRQ